MMRSKTSTSFQKTYDECYLKCSTAVYFEGQGNEAEALQSWRSALDQIYYHNAYRVPANYRPKSETEKALCDSLRDMEIQCKERVDLLEALRLSRQEAQQTATGQPPAQFSKLSKTTSGISTDAFSSDMNDSSSGLIGGGSIPVISAADIPRPGPALPSRPSLSSIPKNLSQRAVVGRTNSSTSVNNNNNLSAPRHASGSSAKLAPPSSTLNNSRSPSPDKQRSMRTTLRSANSGSEMKQTMRNSPRTPTNSKPEPSKAATLAWNALARDRNGKLPNDDTHNLNGSRKGSDATQKSESRPSTELHWDSKTRRLVNGAKPVDEQQSPALNPQASMARLSNNYPMPPNDPGQPGAVAGAMMSPSIVDEMITFSNTAAGSDGERSKPRPSRTPPPIPPHRQGSFQPSSYPTYLKEYPETTARKNDAISNVLPARRRSPPAPKPVVEVNKVSRKPVASNTSTPRNRAKQTENFTAPTPSFRKDDDLSHESHDEDSSERPATRKKPARTKQKVKEELILADPTTPPSEESDDAEKKVKSDWEKKVAEIMKNLPKGVDEGAAKQIFNEIVVQGDEVHWEDVAGLDIAKNALKEAVVYPFLRPDLFLGLREPARGMLLFGPPGTGKTMLARAVATESRSTFFSISASSLTSKYLGESEKLVRALFQLAKALAPSIIFVDEIDSLLSARSGSGEHEATRRIKTEFLIQWSDLQRAAAGREQTQKEKERGDASRVLVLAATNLPWAIDEAARRRFVRRQYIPLPEDDTRKVQLQTLLGHQKHSLTRNDLEELIHLTEGFSGSDITALAKDAAMGPLRSLGEALLHMSMDQIRPIQMIDFHKSLVNIRPSVSKQGLKEFEDWAREFGERGG